MTDTLTTEETMQAKTPEIDLLHSLERDIEAGNTVRVLSDAQDGMSSAIFGTEFTRWLVDAALKGVERDGWRDIYREGYGCALSDYLDHLENVGDSTDTNMLRHYIESRNITIPPSKQEVAVASEGVSPNQKAANDLIALARNTARDHGDCSCQLCIVNWIVQHSEFQRGFETCREMAGKAIWSARFAYDPLTSKADVMQKAAYEHVKAVRALTPTTAKGEPLHADARDAYNTPAKGEDEISNYVSELREWSGDDESEDDKLHRKSADIIESLQGKQRDRLEIAIIKGQRDSLKAQVEKLREALREIGRGYSCVPGATASYSKLKLQGIANTALSQTEGA